MAYRNYAQQMQDEMNRLFREAEEQINARGRSDRQRLSDSARHLPGRSHYSVLGIQPGATKDEIKKAYRKKAKEHHPDRGGDPVKFNEIQKAYEALH